MNAIIAYTFPQLAKSSGAYPFVLFSAMMVVQFFVVLFFYPETKESRWNRCSTAWALNNQERQVRAHSSKRSDKRLASSYTHELKSHCSLK